MTQEPEVKYDYVKPNPEAFENSDHNVSSVIPEGTLVHILQRVEYPESGGIYSYYDGVLFPRKSMPFPDAIYANDISKRVLMLFINSFAKPAFVLPALAFGILPWKLKIKTLQSILTQWCRVSDYLLAPYYLKKNRYCDICKELRGFLKRFFIELGIDAEVADNSAKTFIAMIEFDDAYRYRLEDIFSILGYAMILKNPRNAVKVAVETFAERELDKNVSKKIKAFGDILRLVLLSPRIKKAFILAFEPVSYHKMCLDEADAYHTLIWSQYNFQGMPLADRIKVYTDMHTKVGVTTFPPILKLVRK